jgi:hypothetical protein
VSSSAEKTVLVLDLEEVHRMSGSIQWKKGLPALPDTAILVQNRLTCSRNLDHQLAVIHEDKRGDTMSLLDLCSDRTRKMFWNEHL